MRMWLCIALPLLLADSMVGDVNMFLSEGSPAAEGEQPSLVAEIDIMIASTAKKLVLKDQGPPY